MYLIITRFRGSSGQLEKYTGTECAGAKCLHKRSDSVHARTGSGRRAYYPYEQVSTDVMNMKQSALYDVTE